LLALISHPRRLVNIDTLRALENGVSTRDQQQRLLPRIALALGVPVTAIAVNKPYRSSEATRAA